MVFRRFTVGIFVRLGLLFVTLGILAYFISNFQFPATVTLISLLAILQMVGIFRFVNRTNRELTSFINAIEFGDYLHTASFEHLGSSFRELNEAFENIIKKLREKRSHQEEKSQYLEALVEHTPVALIALQEDGKTELLNTAAEKLFDQATLSSLEDIKKFGPRFFRDLSQAKNGEAKMTQLKISGEDLYLIMATTSILVRGKERKLVSLQNIQSEIDATELAAWQDLVRVLSHEIMNSITPVASLARTSVEMAEDILKPGKNERTRTKEAKELRDAVSTVARRSEGLMRFVQNYRTRTYARDKNCHFEALYAGMRGINAQHAQISLVVKQGTSFDVFCSSRFAREDVGDVTPWRVLLVQRFAGASRVGASLAPWKR